MTQEFTLDQTKVTAFASNMRLPPQQNAARIVPYVMAEMGAMVRGDSWTSEFGGLSEPAEKTGLAPKTPESFMENSRRMGWWATMHDAKWLDKGVTLEMLADPSSATLQAMRAGKERARDRLLMATFFATQYEGRNGQTAVTFPGTQEVGVQDQKYYRGRADDVAAPSAADRGLTPAKLRNAKDLLDESELEGERFIAVSSEDLGHLLTSVEVTSQDYNTVQALHDGRINSFMGFTFVRCSKSMFAVASSIRDLPAWIKPAIEYKSTEIEDIGVNIRTDRSNTPQAYYSFRHSAIRAFDNGVVRIKTKVLT
jgi:hypothetical protein